MLSRRNSSFDKITDWQMCIRDSTTPKWKGAPYHIAFDTQAAKPNPTGITIPAIKYTANPDALENRASLVVRFDSSGVAKDRPVMDQMILPPVDIHGAEGTLPASYMDVANKGLTLSLIHIFFFLPFAGKMRILQREDHQRREMMLEGVISILEGMNPRMIEVKLSGFVADSSHQAVERAA